jgi:hypothetical protein
MLTDKAAEFRREADECREQAMLTTDPVIRERWTEIAEHWETLAAFAEKAKME